MINDHLFVHMSDLKIFSINAFSLMVRLSAGKSKNLSLDYKIFLKTFKKPVFLYRLADVQYCSKLK